MVPVKSKTYNGSENSKKHPIMPFQGIPNSPGKVFNSLWEIGFIVAMGDYDRLID